MRKLVIWLTVAEHKAYKDNQESFMVERALKPTFMIGLLMVLISLFVAVTKDLNISLAGGLILLLILVWKLRKSKLNWLRRLSAEEYNQDKSLTQKHNFLTYFLAALITMIISMINLFVGVVCLGFTFIILILLKI